MAFDKVKYDNDFKRQNYDRQELLLPKGKKLVLQSYAKSHGKSVSQIVIEALEEHCKLDLSNG